jgi:hypothetical protein
MASGRERRELVTRLCDAYGVSRRWLRTLRLRAQRRKSPKAVGRPRIPDAERARVRALVAEQLDLQGWTTGPLPILEAIREKEPKVSAMLVQQATAAIKREVRSRIDREIRAKRESHEVLAKDAVWCEDTTHLARLPDGEEVADELITDRGTLSTVSLSAGPPPTAQDVNAELDRGAAERGGMPLVLQRDRAGIHGAKEVMDRLARDQVVTLDSRVHTPTDNPLAENRNREFKKESGLGKGVVLDRDEDAVARLAPTRRRLHVRLRASRGWKSSAELDLELPRADALVDRARFYEEANAAKKAAVLGLSDPDEIAKAEQDAVWRTLEKHGLARLHVGPRRTPSPRPAPVAPASAG